MIEVTGPIAWPRGGSPPAFRVSGASAAGGDVYTAIEVATDAATLGATERPPGAFYGSWQDGPLRPPGEFVLPQPVWERLAAAPRLYYRALASISPDAWTDHEVSVRHDVIEAAPFTALLDVECGPDVTATQLQRVWLAALSSVALAAVAQAEGATAVVIRHASSPKRPMREANLQWVVVVSSQVGNTVHEAVGRLVEPELIPRTTDFVNGARFDVDPFEVVSRELADELKAVVEAHPDRFLRRGPVAVWQHLSPPPAEDLGGTVLVSLQTGRVLFAATTSWQGGRVLTG